MQTKRKRIVAITSGKGGVGKSSIVSNMAYLLSAEDMSTCILDADFALGNIDIMFGLIPKLDIKDLLEGRRQITEIIMEGPYGIKIIPATSGISEFSNLSTEERGIILTSFRELPDYDFLLIDTSAGISSNVIYFNGISEAIVVVVTPDPASITDSYAVIKVLSKKTGRKDFNIVFNMVKDEEEALSIFKKLTIVTDKFLDVYLNFYGYIPTDNHIVLAVKKQKLWAEQFPETEATKALKRICQKLIV